MERTVQTGAGAARDVAAGRELAATRVAYVADGPAADAPWVGVLYESSEWSDFNLAQELAARDLPVRLIDMERPDAVRAALSCRLLVSRVFASALARGHAVSHAHMAEVVARAGERGIALINPGRAHAFEISKRAATEALARAGIAVPKVYACDVPGAIDPAALAYPCLIKPDCGGRSARTAVLRSADEARAFLAEAPAEIAFIVESFERARAGYLTRIEIVGGRAAHLHRRSIAANGLSSYHFGSTYEPYGDCPEPVVAAAERAAALLGFEVGSFDVIETAEAAVFIDANAVSNVSADCEELLGYDLMAEHAAYIAGRYRALFG
ncbi:ATP-grasp domain-containing protein [Collinsella intestinalis]|uniref:ATP-grasp domain-containing protein n=1 Tax=Collinsella intestinalis TaxID=147207 RepID=UPI0025A4483A|nr:hypothetical protein [Collinsella intestinalis]MDM8162822.1 hypothetical protein [Collinsella intestinalis]